MRPTDKEWEVAEKIYGLTRDRVHEKILHEFNRKFLSGYDRHSYGLIMGTPEIIEKYGLLNLEEYPGANMINDSGLPLNHPKIKEQLRKIRTREGVTLLEISPDGPKILKNGLKLPQPLTNELLEKYGAESTGALTNYLEMDDELGSKTLAFLSLSLKAPEVSMVRLDEKKYVLKGGSKHNLSLKNKFPLSVF